MTYRKKNAMERKKKSKRHRGHNRLRRRQKKHGRKGRTQRVRQPSTVVQEKWQKKEKVQTAGE